MTDQSIRPEDHPAEPADPGLARLLDEMLALSEILPHVEEREDVGERHAAA